MRESNFSENGNYGIVSNVNSQQTMIGGVAPFFSMRKLRLIYNQLIDDTSFEYNDFESFKHQVLNSVAPQVELNKWQAIAARR